MTTSGLVGKHFMTLSLPLSLHLSPTVHFTLGHQILAARSLVRGTYVFPFLFFLDVVLVLMLRSDAVVR